MLRNDYDIFLKEFNNSNSRFKFRSCEIDNDYYYPFAKVIDTNTIMYEPDENGIKGGVYVDIFVHDNAPDDDKASNKMYQKKELYNKFRIAQIFPNLYDKTSIKKRIMRFFINIYLKFLPKNYYAKKMVTNSKKYMNQETKRIGDFAAPYKIMVDKKVFKEFIPMKFEKKNYPVPIGYDEYLSEIYGDYMKLPPKEKQVSNHSFVAYYKD